MFRALSVVIAAIKICQPSMSDSVAEGYAKIVQEEAKARNFDPITLVVMVYNESRWRASVVNSVNCIGLGQVCLSNYPYCRSTDFKGEKCLAKKAQLLGGHYNLRMTARSISLNRKFCRKRTGKPALWRYWLPSHGGYNSPSRGIWCGQKKVKGKWRNVPIPKTVSRIMKHRKKLIRQLRRKKRG
jgi:hypothetical protein